MGLVKNQMIMEYERGFDSIDTVVCVNCIKDYALKKFVSDNGEEDDCYYCETRATCVETEMLMDKIMSDIAFKYSKAVEELGYDDGEYVGITYNSVDVVESVLWEAVDEGVLYDLMEITHDDLWCDYNPYRMSLSAEQSYMWMGFSEMVKKHNRYMFFKTHSDDEKPDYMILNEIAQATEDFDLYKIIEPNELFYRGRMHDRKTEYTTSKELCSPPHENAKSNRMSAEGISVFYGADNIETVVAEIFDSAYSYVTVVAFKNLRELVILDLTRISDMSIPSIFDEENRALIEPIKFLRELLDDLTRPIESMFNIEYIPAQVIAEYFRFVHKHDGKKIDGIAYNSSKQKDGVCFVLFVEHNKCFPQNDCEKTWNYDPGYQILEMDADSLNTYKVDNNIALKIIKT